MSKRKYCITLSSDTRTHFDNNVLKDIIVTLKELTNIIESTLTKNETLISGCKNKYFKYANLRRILYLLDDIRENKKTIQENESTYDNKKWVGSVELFYMDIYNISTINDEFISSIPIDAYDTLCYLCMHSKDFYISECEGKALYYRYIETKDLDEVGHLLDNVSSERARMIIVEAIQKLKSQKVNVFLRYGLSKYNLIQDEIEKRTQEEIIAVIRSHDPEWDKKSN